MNWDPPLLERQNGVIRGYAVFYRLTNSSEVPENKTTTNRTSVELSGLMIFTSYTVQIRAFTKVGLGPFSDESMNRTLESCEYILSSINNLVRVFSCSNTESIRDDPCWTTGKNSSELIEPLKMTKVRL